MDYCLNMPANHFFLMLTEARKFRALERIEECDIAAIPAAQTKYFEYVRGKYERALDLDKVVPGQENPETRPVVDAASQDAKHMMMAFFSRGKGAMH